MCIYVRTYVQYATCNILSHVTVKGVMSSERSRRKEAKRTQKTASERAR